MTFRFTIRHLGIFLNKSPVTIRNWERKGLMTLPRVGNNRALEIKDIRTVAATAYRAGRISSERKALINETLALLTEVEQETE